MSQFGMQMPAGQMQRGASMNVYTGLLFVAVVALLSASAFVYVQGKSVAPDENPFAAYQMNASGGGYDLSKLPK